MTKLARFLENVAAFVILPMLTILVTVDVVLRYAFNSPLSWALEASQHMLLVFYLGGLLISVLLGIHIKVELFTHLLNPAARRLVQIVSGLALTVVFGALAYKAATEIPFAYSLPKLTPDIQLRVWVFYALVSMVSFLVAVAGVMNAFRGEQGSVGDDEAPDA